MIFRIGTRGVSGMVCPVSGEWVRLEGGIFMWMAYALGSALLAGVTSILAK